MAASTVDAERTTGELKDNLSELGFEVYPLKVLALCFGSKECS